MADLSVGAVLCSKTLAEDFVKTITHNKDYLTEIAFASPGTSRFSRAIYFERLNSSDLIHLVQKKENISFAAGFCKESLGPIAIGSKTTRKGADQHIKLKSIISFDIDFKDNVSEYKASMRQELISSFATKIKNSLVNHNIPLWMLAFSGNGLHLHFKLSNI